MSSSSYKTNAIVSQGAGSSSSPNYNTEIVTDVATGSANSSSYKTTSFLSIPPKPTPSAPSTTGGGAPGGGAVTTFAPSFSLNTNFLPIEIKVGQSGKQGILVTDTGQINLTISISVLGLQQYLFPEQTSLVLTPGESQMIYFDINSFNNTIPDIYPGQIIFQSENLNQTVNIALDIVAKKPLFDIITSVLTKKVSPGNSVNANITVINMGDIENVDVQVLSKIIDFSNNTYSSKIDTYAITNQITKKVSLNLPSNIPYGDYLFYSKVDYGNITASSYDTFSVVKPSIFGFLSGIFPLLSQFFSGIAHDIKSPVLEYSAPPIIILIFVVIFFTVRIIIHVERKKKIWKT